MLRIKNSVIYALALMMMDAVLLLAAFYAAFFIRNIYYVASLGEGPVDIYRYQWLLPILIGVHLLTLGFTGIYLSSRRQLYLKTSMQVLQGILLGGLISAAVVFYTKSQLLSRLYFMVFSGALLILMLLAHNFIVFFLGWLHRQGFHQRKILVISAKENSADAISIFKKQPQWGFQVVKIISPDQPINAIFDEQPIDEVFLNITPEEISKIQNTIMLCENRGIPFHFYSNILPVKYSKPQLDFFIDEPILSYYRKYLSLDQKLLKRGMDLLGGLLGSLITLLITPWVALLIKLEDGGPVFFTQSRIGLKQNIFKIYKFRTMRVDAEKIEEQLKEQNEMQDKLFKMKDDPRVTRIGRWLRKTSLDEFPQFFNVLLGQMSLVGPRPIAEKYIDKHEEHHYHRLNMKPGLTGLWQVRGRNKIVSYERMVELDNRYIDFWSIGMDIKIIWQTLKILTIKKTGY